MDILQTCSLNDIRKGLNISIYVSDPKRMPGESIMVLPYTMGRTALEKRFAIFHGASISLIQFDKAGFKQYSMTHAVWNIDDLPLSRAEEAIKESRRLSDRLDTSWILRKDTARHDDIEKLSYEVLLANSMHHAKTTHGALDAFRDAQLPSLVRRSYDPDLPEGQRRLLENTSRTLYAVDVPSELVPVLRRQTSSDAIFMAQSTGFSMSMEGILQAVTGYRAIRAYAGLTGAPIPTPETGDSALMLRQTRK